MTKRINVTDRPRRPSLANYEQRLRKFRTVFALIIEDIDDALADLAKEKKPEQQDA